MKEEGLYTLIPEHRRRSLFLLPIPLLWGSMLFVLVVGLVLAYGGISKLVVGVLAFAISFAVTFILFIGFHTILQVRARRPWTEVSDTQARRIGGFLIIVFPVVLAACVAINVSSWMAGVYYITLASAATGLMLFLQYYAYRIHLLFELLLSIAKTLPRSVTLLPVLITLLLVVVLLSIFSQELWQAVNGLSPLRFVGVLALLVLPAVLFVLSSVGSEAFSLVQHWPTDEEIAKHGRSTPLIKRRLEEGFISPEEWQQAIDGFRWRHKSRLAADLLPLVRRRVARLLRLSVVVTSTVLALAFFVYFFVLLSAVIGPSLVEAWTNIESKTLGLPIALGNYRWNIPIPTVSITVAKVSLFLAVFESVVFSVYSLTDDTVKSRLTCWLRKKAASWVAVGALYQSVSSPNYQIWEYVVDNKKDGIANVSIVVPRGLSESNVEQACEHMQSRLEGYWKVVIVTAFEQDVERPVYKLGIPGQRWRLIHNKPRGLKKFEPMHLSADELRYQNGLGRDRLEEGREIPDEWFGNSPRGVRLGKFVWATDPSHELIMHPYVYLSDAKGRSVFLDVHVLKRLGNPEQYRDSVRKWLALIRTEFPDLQTVSVDVYFRDSLDWLAHMFWDRQLSYVDYKDESQKESRIESPSDWDLE